ncbi:hypothetical protein DIS24_g10423 [Lasiodiplodia hormozganensis]|uniref:Uncharacterized protein n=1 Tax=Lasiodiplodia hormozganensis TaxID=869390 RepID=A0AA40CGV5_9PEZI|nr:hypothetical protein DIS24_g10423 [Lasiodiplodia hormozganensis]
MRFGILSVLTALYFSAVCVATTCTPESQPNPIAGTKFKLDPLTGTANGTLAIILIPIDEALKIIGSKYTIQTGAYRELVPAMPKDAYPAFLQAAIEHDVQQADGVKLPDFTRISIEFPFLTIPDGNPSKLFRLIKSQLVSASNADAVSQSASYGANVISATFDPPCDPYAYTRDGDANFLQGFKKGDTGNGDIQFDSKWKTVDSPDGQMPWPVSFFVNITNQPSFTVPDQDCLVQLTSFDDSISQGQWSPVVVKGFVDVAGDLYNGGDAKKWDDVWGIQVDHTFIRLHHVDCLKL